MSTPAAVPPQPTKTTGGVLPIPAAATTQHQPNGSNKTQAKSTTARLKVLIRRLPPGITQAEVQTGLGEAWQPGKGKVDWVSFRPGKASKDQAKPSRPARLYLQVTNAIHLEPLSETVRTATFTDARNTSSDPVLLGPPILEFAPLQRVPAGKRRNDARQGTIDQDPEFMEFLESLISPITKQVEIEEETPRTKVTTTPLIQHLREKKAAKEAAKQKKEKEKTTKQATQASKDVADKKIDSNAAAANVKDVPTTPAKRGGRQAKVEKAAVKAVPTPQKVMKKETPAIHTKPPQTAAKPATSATPNTSNVQNTATSTPQTAPTRRAEINPAQAAARMLQRDLGIRGGRGGTLPRRGGRPVPDTVQPQTDSATTPANTAQATKPAVTVANPSQASSSIITPQPATSNNNIKRNAPNQAQVQHPIPKPTPAAKPPPTAQSTPTRPLPPMPTSGLGFLKHANPSQGITEPLLLTALSPFGAVIKVEIDKRKGFAYVEYAEPSSLQKAIHASPIKVAQGAVQVQEKKDRSGGGSVNGRANVPPMQMPMQAPRGPAAMAGAGRGTVPVNAPGRQAQMFQPGRPARGRGGGAGAHGGNLHTTHAPGSTTGSVTSEAAAKTTAPTVPGPPSVLSPAVSATPPLQAPAAVAPASVPNTPAALTTPANTDTAGWN